MENNDYPSFLEFREKEEMRRGIIERLDNQLVRIEQIERKLELLRQASTAPEMGLDSGWGLYCRPNNPS